MARRPLPSFSRILLYPNAPHLPLPHPFVQKHLENKIPENPILLSVNGGYSWRLTIEKVGENYCFADGWENVVEDSHLEFGDFLVFWLIDHSTFKLSIYSPSGCQKDFPVETDDVNEDEVDEEEEEEEEEAAEIKVEEKDEEEAEEDEDYNEFEKDEDEEGEFEEEEEEEEEDEDDEDEYDDDGEEDDDGDEDEDGGGDVDGDDGDPFFMAVISKSHERSMRLPLEFTRLAGIDSARRVTVKNMDGNEWKMKLLSHSRHYASNKSDKKDYACKNYTRYSLSKGWSEFKRVNDLCEGDECVFTFIRSEDKLCLAKVTKKRVPAKPPAGKAPVAEVLKRSREETTREEVVEKKEHPKKPADKAPVTEVSKRLRGRPPREVVVEKKERSNTPAGKVPVVEVLERPRGRPPRVEKKVRSKKPVEKVPAAEVLKRTRGRPSRVEVMEKKGRGRKPAGKAPAAQVLKRKRRRPSRVEVESKDEEGGKRSRGRPFKRKRGRPAANVR